MVVRTLRVAAQTEITYPYSAEKKLMSLRHNLPSLALPSLNDSLVTNLVYLKLTPETNRVSLLITDPISHTTLSNNRKVTRMLQSVSSRSDHTMCLWLIVVDMKRTRYTRVVNKALKTAYLNYISV